MTVASRAIRSMPPPASTTRVPITSSAATTAAEKSRPTQGLRRLGCSFAKTPGTTSSRAIPYRILGWVTTATSVVLVMATHAMTVNRVVMKVSGTGTTSALTTSSSATGDVASPSAPTTSAAVAATST